MPFEDGGEPEPQRHLTTRDALVNLVEYARSFLFALDNHDKPHQEHFKAQLEHALQAADEKLKRMPRVRHYKGGLYGVLNQDALIEAQGDESLTHVVYESEHDGRVWIRPFHDFHGLALGATENRGRRFVEVDEAGVPR